MPDIIVSNSEIQCFKLCKRKWYLTYVRKLRKPENPVGALSLGTAVHEALGAYYEPEGNSDKAMILLDSIYSDKLEAFQEKFDEIQKDYRLASTMVQGYFQWVEEEGIDQNLIILESEAEIEAELVLPSGLHAVVLGKRDLIGQDEHGRKFFLDFKTAQTLVDPLIDINEQLLTYALLHKLTNPEDMPQYAIWRMLRKVLRSERAKPPFFASEQIELSDRVLRNFYIRLTGTLEDMARVKADLAAGAEHRFACYPTASSRCSWGCEFRAVCPAIDRDVHYEEYLSNEFEEHNPYSRYEKGVLE